MTGLSDPILLAVGPWVCHQVVFWPVVALFHRVDTTGRPDFIARYRIQEGPRRQPPLARSVRLVCQPATAR